ncbi:MAG TPA: branched-chain amino acid ABC transporter permease [Thermoleophilaceae bacterium]|nr:branched-chain amino acid ABC transporter permease [Thermoleophilaceae bacterium]
MTTTFQTIIDAASFGGLYALLGLGIALIFGVMRMINFAHGEFITAGAYTLFFVSGVPLLAMVALAIIAVMTLAVATERIAFRPVRDAPPSTLLMTSFAVSFFLQSLAIMIFGTRAKGVDVAGGLLSSVDIAGLSVSKLTLVTIATTIALMIGVGAVLTRTSLGVEIRAAAEDFDMARLLGIRGDRVIAAAFAMSGTLAAVAAVLLVAQGGTVTPTMGLTPVLIAFVATIIGGMGRLGGAVLGGFVLGTLTVVLQEVLPLEMRPYRDALVYTAVIVVLVFRPQGIIGVRSVEDRL